jgi:3-oxoadipate enol-lactonase
MRVDAGRGQPKFVDGEPRIAYDETGSGESVVFLHGIGGNRSNWRDQLPVFGHRYRAVAWDARGWGDSDDYDGALDFADFSADLIRLLDALGEHSAHFVGLSMGGFILQDFYARHPDRIRSLVLADTSRGPRDDHDDAWVEDFLRLRRKPLLDGLTPAQIAPAVVKSLAGRSATPAHIATLEASIAALHKDSYLKAMDSVMRYSIPLDRSTIDVPVLVLVGAEDTLTPPEAGQRLAESIPGSRYQVIAEAGHLSNIERPEAFNQAVLDFLESIRQ